MGMTLSKRSAIFGVGIAIVVFAVALAVINFANLVPALTNYLGGASSPLPFNTSFLALILLILGLFAFAFLGILMFMEGSRLKKGGAVGTWCIMAGLGDLLVAAVLFFNVLVSVISLNYQAILNATDFNFSLINMLFTLCNIPAWLLGVAAGALYFLSGYAQRKLGKLNLMLVIAGAAFVVYSILAAATNVLTSVLPPVPYYVLQLVISVLILVGRGLRGLSPLQYPKTIPASPFASNYAYAQPQPYNQQYAQAQQAQPQYAQPQPAQPQYAQPQPVQPQSAPPQYAQPQAVPGQTNSPQPSPFDQQSNPPQH